MPAWTTRGLCPQCAGTHVTSVGTAGNHDERVVTRCPECGWSKRRTGPLTVRRYIRLPAREAVPVR